MKKILTKIIMAFTSLALIATTVTTIIMTNKYNQLNEKNEESASLAVPGLPLLDLSKYKGNLQIVYSSTEFIDDSSTIITSLDGLTSFYMSFYLVIDSGIDGLQVEYTFDKSQVQSITPTTLSGLSRKDPNYNRVMNGTDNGCYFGTQDFTAQMSASTYADDSGNPQVVILCSSGGNIVTPYSADESPALCIAKLKIDLNTGVSSMSAKCSGVTIGNGDDASEYPNAADKNFSGCTGWDTNIGAGSISNKTDTTGTYDVGSTTGTALTASGKTLTATIPADATGNVTIHLTVDGGKGSVDSVTGSGFSGTDTVTVAVPGRGNTATATVHVLAQDGTTDDNYTLNVVQEKYDDKQLTGMTIADASATPSAYAPNFTFNAGNNDTATVNTEVKISSSTTSVKFTPTHSTTTGIQSVTVNGTTVANGSPSGAVPVSNNSTVNVVVTAEDGTTKTYAYKFTTISSDTTLSSVTIKNQSGVVLGNATLSGDTWTLTIPYETSGNVNTGIQLAAVANKTGNTVVISNTSVISFPNTTSATSITSPTITVTDTETSESKTWKIQINRSEAPAEKGVTAIDVLNGTTSLGVTGSGNTYTASTHLAYTINSVNLKVTLTDSKATWRLDSEAASVKHASGAVLPYTFDVNGTKKKMTASVNIIVTAQNGDDNSASPYVVTWERDGASSETGITNIGSGGVTIKDSDNKVYAYTYNDSTKTLTLNDKVPYKYNDVYVSALLKDTKCTVFTIDGKNATNGAIIQCPIGTAAQKNEVQFSITMHVEAEDGTKMDYTINGTRAAADTDNSIVTNGVEIKAIFDDGTSAVQSATVNASGVYVLDNDLPHSANSLQITVTLPSGSKATLKIDNKTTISGTAYNYTIAGGNAAITNQLIPISITSESGAVNALVTGVQFNRKEADTDAGPKEDGSGNRLALVVTDGTNSYSGSWSGNEYIVTGVPYSVNTLYLEVDKNSPLAKLYFASETVEWDRTTTPQKSFAAGTPADTTAHDFQTTFKIKPEVGAAVTYTVKGTRAGANSDAVLDKRIVYGATTNLPISEYTPSGSIAANNYYYKVKLSENTQVKFEFTCSSSTTKIEFSTNGSTYQEWKNAVATGLYDANNKIYYVKLTPESGASGAVTYTLHIDAADERNDNALLQTLTVQEDSTSIILSEKNGKTFDTTGPDTYYYEVPFGTKTLTVTAIPQYHTAKVYKDISKNSAVLSIDVSKLTADAVTSFTYIVQAENETWTSKDGSTTSYVIQIKRLKGNSDAYLTDLKVMGKTVPGFTTSDSYKTYDVIVPRTATSVPFSYVGPTGATITPATPGMITITNGKGTVTIDVLSEDKTNPNQYIVNVYAADTEYGINDLHVLDYKQSITSGDQGQDVVSNEVDVLDKDGNVCYVHGTTATDASGYYIISVPFSISDVYLLVKPKNANAVITGDGKVSIAAGATVTRTVKITSEYGSLNPSATSTSVEYKFKITREQANTENRLDTLVITTNKGAIADSQCNFTQNSGPQNSNSLVVSKVDPAVSYLDLTTTLVTGAKKISIDGDTTGRLTARIPFSENEKTITILVYSEDLSATPRKYELKVSREEVKLDDDASLTKIEILGDDNKHYDYDFALDPNPATKTLDPHVNSVTITVTAGSEKATKVIEYEYPNGNKGTVASGSPLTVPVGTTKLTIYAKSEDGQHETTPKINIELKKEKLGDNAELNEINVDGTPIPNPDPTKPSPVYLPGGTTAVPVTADPKDPKAKVTIPGLDGDGKLPVQPGKNTVTVTVQPEDPSVDPKSYVVEIYVDESTLLDTLTVEDTNSKLLTMTPTFNPNHNTYEVTIPYDMAGVTIRYTLPSTSDASLLTITGDGYHAVASTQTFDVVVTPKSGAAAANTYKVKVIKEIASPDCKLLTVDMEGAPVPDFNPDITTGYVLIVPRSTNSITISNTTCSTGATITLPSDISLAIGSNTKTIKVTAQDGVHSQNYQFEIIRADKEFDITNIRILDALQNGNPVKDINGNEFAFNTLGGAYPNFEVANTVQTVYIEITKKLYAYINIDGSDETASYQKVTYIYPFALSKVGSTQPNTISIYSLAELLHEVPDQTTYKSPTHTISIVRHDLDDDATLKSLSVMIGGVEKIINFNPAKDSYDIDEIGTATGFNIAAVPNKQTSKVLSGLGTNGYVAWPSNIGQDFSYTHTVTVIAENGNTKDYKINLSRGKGDPNEDNTIADIIIRDDQGKNSLFDI